MNVHAHTALSNLSDCVGVVSHVPLPLAQVRMRRSDNTPDVWHAFCQQPQVGSSALCRWKGKRPDRVSEVCEKHASNLRGMPDGQWKLLPVRGVPHSGDLLTDAMQL